MCYQLKKSNINIVIADIQLVSTYPLIYYNLISIFFMSTRWNHWKISPVSPTSIWTAKTLSCCDYLLFSFPLVQLLTFACSDCHAYLERTLHIYILPLNFPWKNGLSICSICMNPWSFAHIENSILITIKDVYFKSWTKNSRSRVENYITTLNILNIKWKFIIQFLNIKGDTVKKNQFSP